MKQPDPTPVARARGALFGLAAGAGLDFSALPTPTPELPRVHPASGIGRDEGREAAAAAGAELALAWELADELLQPEVDLRRLAHRWIDWMTADGRGLDSWTRTALRHIATHDSPPAGAEAPAGDAVLPRAFPLALATYSSPANLVSGTFHVVALTHPHPWCTWGAVAVNVAAARFLANKRDFIADVIEALRNNDAPDELLTAVRRVPIERGHEAMGRGEAGTALGTMEQALWLAYHEPGLERGLRWLAGAAGGGAATAVAGGLLGARDGFDALPARWVSQVPQAARLALLAERLVAG